MEKNFDKWNIKKQEINIRNELVLFHEREIWWCSVGVNIGYEQDGKNELFERPVLVIKKFNRDVLWVLPLTRSNKQGGYYYSTSIPESSGSVIILSQLRLISSKRLLRKMGMISKVVFKDIIKKIISFFPR